MIKTEQASTATAGKLLTLDTVLPITITKEYSKALDLGTVFCCKMILLNKTNLHLALVDSAAHNGLLARRLPLVNALVRPNVSNTVGIHLNKRKYDSLKKIYESPRRNSYW